MKSKIQFNFCVQIIGRDQGNFQFIFGRDQTEPGRQNRRPGRDVRGFDGRGREINCLRFAGQGVPSSSQESSRSNNKQQRAGSIRFEDDGRGQRGNAGEARECHRDRACRLDDECRDRAEDHKQKRTANLETNVIILKGL
jgi:hypothetical protein